MYVFYSQGKWSMPSIRNFWKYTVITYCDWDCFSSQHHAHLSLDAGGIDYKCCKCDMLFLGHFCALNAFCTSNTIPGLYIWYFRKMHMLLLEFTMWNKWTSKVLELTCYINENVKLQIIKAFRKHLIHLNSSLPNMLLLIFSNWSLILYTLKQKLRKKDIPPYVKSKYTLVYI